jgi:hypothetical protein
MSFYRVIFPLEFLGFMMELVLLDAVLLVETDDDDDDGSGFMGKCFCGCCCCRPPRAFVGLYASIVVDANFREGDGLVVAVFGLRVGPF